MTPNQPNNTMVACRNFAVLLSLVFLLAGCGDHTSQPRGYFELFEDPKAHKDDLSIARQAMVKQCHGATDTGLAMVFVSEKEKLDSRFEAAEILDRRIATNSGCVDLDGVVGAAETELGFPFKPESNDFHQFLAAHARRHTDSEIPRIFATCALENTGAVLGLAILANCVVEPNEKIISLIERKHEWSHHDALNIEVWIYNLADRNPDTALELANSLHISKNPAVRRFATRILSDLQTHPVETEEGAASGRSESQFQ